MGRFLRFVFFLILILSIFPLYTRFKAAAGPIPPGIYLAGEEMSHYKDPVEIADAIRSRFRDPVAVYFGDERLVLSPEQVEFHVDAEIMLMEASSYLNGPDFIDISLRHLLGLEQRRRDVPLRFTLNHAKLRDWLAVVADDHNRQPQSARAVPPQWEWTDDGSADMLPTGFTGSVQDDWRWTLGTPGQTLLVDESVQAVVDTLVDPQHHAAHLVLSETDPPPLSMDALAQVLDSFTSDFPGFAAIYVQDLASGEEATVDVDVAFSGMSTMKVAIVTEAYRQLDAPPETFLGQWIDYALGESSNAAANEVLRWNGNTDIYAGGRRVTEMMRALGFTNSFIQTGYEDKSNIAAIPTAANQRTDWDTDPDPHLQSTPADMGRLLAEIYRCRQGEGKLIETFGDALTPRECQDILYYMTHDEFQELIWGGLPRPKTAWIVHKHGFVNEAHSDLALVWGPTGPYVLSVYLWRNGWMDWDTSNTTMNEISRIVWNYFQFKAEVEGIERPEAPYLDLPPNYVAIHPSYDSFAANRLRPQPEDPQDETASLP
ncbi:MAG: serine hydrolase [Caldilineaceae bacterium]